MTNNDILEDINSVIAYYQSRDWSPRYEGGGVEFLPNNNNIVMANEAPQHIHPLGEILPNNNNIDILDDASPVDANQLETDSQEKPVPIPVSNYEAPFGASTTTNPVQYSIVPNNANVYYNTPLGISNCCGGCAASQQTLSTILQQLRELNEEVKQLRAVIDQKSSETKVDFSEDWVIQGVTDTSVTLIKTEGHSWCTENRAIYYGKNEKPWILQCSLQGNKYTQLAYRVICTNTKSAPPERGSGSGFELVPWKHMKSNNNSFIWTVDIPSENRQKKYIQFQVNKNPHWTSGFIHLKRQE